MNKKSTFRSVANNYLTHPKENSGITLIALIVTIIVLLILAGIAVNTLAGENGVINRTTKAKTKTELSNFMEDATMAYNGLMVDKLTERKNNIRSRYRNRTYF